MGTALALSTPAILALMAPSSGTTTLRHPIQSGHGLAQKAAGSVAMDYVSKQGPKLFCVTDSS